MKLRLYIAAVNTNYGRNAFLPLAAGLMWGYARTFSEITDAYEMCGMLYRKEPIEDALKRLEGPNGEAPNVVAFSSYIWNHQWNKALAQAVKKKWPLCATLVGGVQVPNNSPRILEENPEFDFGIYGEGEGAFADFLKAHASGLAPFGLVGSLIWRSWIAPVTPDIKSHYVNVNHRHEETPLEKIPSPYLEGLFDDIIARDGHEWDFQAIQETDRGCNYGCSFCAWGDASLTKLNQFSTERVLAEFEWFGKNKIEFLYNANANFAILKRDIELTKALVETKKKYGYPKQMRAAFAKNSNDVVFEISKMLSDAGMLKATTLALQSMDDNTLVQIKRKNIKYEKLQSLSQRYEDAGISTYAELIMGLPGETVESFIAGLDALLEAGQHSGISIYLCMLLENTEMASQESREKYQIESVPMKALLYHGTPQPGIPEEIQETVIGTSTISTDQFVCVVLYAWFVQALHSFGLTQHLARRLHDERSIKYSDFYQRLMAWSMERSEDTVIGGALKKLANIWWDACEEKSWGTVDSRFGDVMWPPEEFLFLLLACESQKFYLELWEFCVNQYGADILPYFNKQESIFIPPKPGHEEEYAREAVWYGRKGPGAKLRVRDWL